MWTHSTKWQDNLLQSDKDVLEKFRKYAKITGVIFVILGLVGIIFPLVLSIATVSLASYLMILGGFISGYFTWKADKEDWLGWLKSLILLVMGLFILYYPINGIAAIGLIMVFYFFMDAFAGFALAFSIRPNKLWWIWLFNAFISLVLGTVFMVGWPFSSTYLVGLFIGISLFFDGISLLVGGSIWGRLGKQ